ncbi:MAG: hypothetical protein ACLTSX_10595 [Collinsella sp.]
MGRARSRSEVWTGKKTGIVADKGVVEDVVNAEGDLHHDHAGH